MVVARLIVVLAVLFSALPADAVINRIWSNNEDDVSILRCNTDDGLDATLCGYTIPWELESVAPSCNLQGQVYYDSGTDEVNVCDGSSWSALASGGGVGDILRVGDCASGACFHSTGTGNALTFEGATADTFETTLTAIDTTTPNKTLSLPNETGTLCSTGSVCSGYQSGTGGIGFDRLTVGSNTAGGLMSCGTGCAIFPVDSGTIVATTAAALTTNPADCGANEFADAIAANGDLACNAIVDADVPDGITVTLADTATALAANPDDCATATHFAVGVTAAGVATCEAIVDADVPDTITVDLAAAATALAANPDDCGAGEFANAIAASGNLTCDTPAGGGSPAFSTITGDTNTTAAMLVGTGASLAPDGNGTVVANDTACPAGMYLDGNKVCSTVLETTECDGSADNVEIQAAIDAATALGGGLVTIVGNGTACDIDADIALKSNVQLWCADNTELKADTTLTTGVFHTASNIDNFSVVGCYINLDQKTKRAISFGTDSTNFRINENQITWNGDGDVYAAPSAPVAFIRGGVAQTATTQGISEINRNSFTGTSDSNDICIQSMGSGYVFGLGTNFHIDGNTMVGCSTGIEANVATVATINANTIWDCEDDCIEGEFTQSNFTANNIYAGNGDGVDCTSCQNVFAVGNNFIATSNIKFSVPSGSGSSGIYFSGNYTASGIAMTTSGTGFFGHSEIVNNVFADSTASMVVVDSPMDLLIANNQMLVDYGTGAFDAIEINSDHTSLAASNIVITGNVMEIEDNNSGGASSCIEFNDAGTNGYQQVLVSDNVCGNGDSTKIPSECVDINGSPTVWEHVAINSNIFDNCTTKIANDPGDTTLCGNRPTSIDTCGGGGGSTVTSDSTSSCAASLSGTSEATVATLADYDNTGASTVLSAGASITAAGGTREFTFRLKIEGSTVETWNEGATSGESAAATIPWLDTTSASARTVILTAQASGSGTHTIVGCGITRVTHD